MGGLAGEEGSSLGATPSCPAEQTAPGGDEEETPAESTPGALARISFTISCPRDVFGFGLIGVTAKRRGATTPSTGPIVTDLPI
jgi:hypothetical protein